LAIFLSPAAISTNGDGLASIIAIASRRAAEAATGVISAPSASFNRRMARACNCETRDSLTPSSAPMSFMVTSL